MMYCKSCNMTFWAFECIIRATGHGAAYDCPLCENECEETEDKQNDTV